MRLIVIILALLFGVTQAVAQIGNVGGVSISPEGLLNHAEPLSEQERRLATTGGHAVKSSPRRMISLGRLEQFLNAVVRGDSALTEEIQYLAGLTAVQTVVFDAEHHDVLLMGPAETWEANESGEIIGTQTGRPVLRLENLAATLEFVFTEADENMLGCSIEPTSDGQQSYARYVNNLRQIDAAKVAGVLRGMELAMGPQEVRIFGIAPRSRLALSLVAADYRLKRLSMGHDAAPFAKFQSYLDLAARLSTGAGPVQQHRFWFVGKYDAVRHTEDRQVWTFQGTGVQVSTTPTDDRATGKKPTRAAILFVESFTRDFPQLVRAVPVLGEVQNAVNLTAVAGLIQRNSNMPGAWVPDTLRQPRWIPLADQAPKRVSSLASVRRIRQKSWMFSVSGGVEIRVSGVLDAARMKVDAGLDDSRRQVLNGRERRHWWWD